MLDRIAVSGWLIVGAIVLFILFTAALFILERKEEKKSSRKVQPLHIVRAQNSKRAA